MQTHSMDIWVKLWFALLKEEDKEEEDKEEEEEKQLLSHFKQ